MSCEILDFKTANTSLYKSHSDMSADVSLSAM